MVVMPMAQVATATLVVMVALVAVVIFAAADFLL
eukprot:COSAG02_NODE_2954_length_7671_cov_103.987718_6_plen_34_part_00